MAQLSGNFSTSAALPGRFSGVTMVISSRRQIASAERPVTIIPLTVGLSVTGKKPVSANRLPVPKNKQF